MVIHSLNHGTAEEKTRLLEILKLKTKDQALIDEAIAIMKNNDSLNYAKQRAEALIQEAWDGIKEFIPNNKFKGCLKTLAEFFVNRST